MNSIYSLLIGVPRYRTEDIADLPMCANDVNLLRDTIAARLGQTNDNITILGDKSSSEVTRSEILRTVTYVSKSAKDCDTLMFYFSGHGTAKNKQGYLVATDTEIDLPADTSIPIPRIVDEFKVSSVRNKLLILDSCYSGVQLSKGMTTIFSDFEQELADLLSNGWTVVTSCQGSELSYFYEEKGLSAFTYFLIEGLNGAAGYDSEKRLSIDNLYQYIFKKTAKWALEKGKSQTPSIKTDRAGTIVFYLQGDNLASQEPISLQPSSVTEGEKEFVLSFKYTSPSSRTLDRILLSSAFSALSSFNVFGQKEPENRYEIIEYTPEQRIRNKNKDRKDFYDAFFGNFMNHFSPSDITQNNEHEFTLPFGGISDRDIDECSYSVALKIQNNKIDEKVLNYLKTIDEQTDHKWESIEYSYDGQFDFAAVRLVVLDRKYTIRKFDVFSKALSVEIPSGATSKLQMSFANVNDKAKIAISSYSHLPKEFFDILPVKELIAQFHATIKKS